jgi:hypothetical protein
MAMIEAGHYKAVIEDPEIRMAANKDTPCFHAMGKITEEGPHRNLRLPWEGWLTESAAKRSIQSLTFAGCTFPPLPGETDLNLEDFTGCGSVEVDVTVEVEEYTPEKSEANPNPRMSKRARIAFINPIGEGRSTRKIDADQRKMIAKGFAALAMQVISERGGAGKAGGDASFDTKAIEGGAKPAGKKLY